MGYKPDYYGQEFVALNEQTGGAAEVIAAPADGRIVIDYFVVSLGTAGTVKFSSMTGGTSDVDHFTLHLPNNGTVTMPNTRIELEYEESFEITSTQTYSALIGYHIER